MKQFKLITIGLLLWSSNVAFAQFNTITQSTVLRKATPEQQRSTSIVPMKEGAADLAGNKPNEMERSNRIPAIVSPLRHIIVTSTYGLRTDPFTKKKVKHSGLDLKAHYEPTYAMTYGKVIKTGSDKRSGKFVTLRHGDYTISYCHLSQIKITQGTYVRPGTTIAVTGNSGRSTGPHLHLTLKKDGKNINPAILLKLIKQTSMSYLFADNIVNPKG